MPRATLTFDLPAEAHEFRQAIDGPEAVGALVDIDNLCRRVLKDAETAYVSVEVLKQIRDLIPSELLDP